MSFIPVCEPFLNGNELKYVTDALSTGWISSAGKYVKEFEQKFAEYCDCKFGVAVSNGTSALHLALVSLGIGKGDEVIIPSFTMIASAFAVCYTGAIPVFVDANKDTWNIDVEKIEEKINTRTKAIMPVHIFGLPCEMDQIIDLAEKYHLHILEDAAEAHGAEVKGRKVGSLSNIAAFSFFANKIITTGEGGMVVTNNEELYNKACYYKNLCFSLDGDRNYKHNDIGFNYRMSNLIAAIGLAQVEKADEYKQNRITNNKLYKEYLKDLPGIIFQSIPENMLNVSWMNAFLIKPKIFGYTRNDLIQHLKKNEVDTRILFSGMHQQKSLEEFGCDVSGEYPVCNELSQNGLYLPSASNLFEETISDICKIIIDFAK